MNALSTVSITNNKNQNPTFVQRKHLLRVSWGVFDVYAVYRSHEYELSCLCSLERIQVKMSSIYHFISSIETIWLGTAYVFVHRSLLMVSRQRSAFYDLFSRT